MRLTEISSRGQSSGRNDTSFDNHFGVMQERNVFGEPSWIIANNSVELALTKCGAHMAPVTFYRDTEHSIRPYYIGFAKKYSTGPQPDVMRGDFFCLPYGSNATPYQGEKHPVHGETARQPWSLIEQTERGKRCTIIVGIEPKVRSGRVTRELSIIEGQHLVYERTTITGFAGRTTMAHHAIVAVPKKERTFLVSTEPFVLGMTCPYQFSDPVNGEYQALQIGARFERIEAIPSIYKDTEPADCSAYPARRGYADLFQTWASPQSNVGWVAGVNTEENYLWFALKDPKVLPSRNFWMENGGRHHHPWNGETCCLGLEDTCSFFDRGIAESSEANAITTLGLPTCHELNGNDPFVVTYIQGVVKTPVGFDRVQTAEFQTDGVLFITEKGQQVFAAVKHSFLHSASLEELEGE
jgi:hypothetical protein